MYPNFWLPLQKWVWKYVSKTTFFYLLWLHANKYGSPNCQFLKLVPSCFRAQKGKYVPGVPAGKHVDDVFENVSDRVSAMGHLVDCYKWNLYKRQSKVAGIEWLPQPESLEKWVIPDRLWYFMRYDSSISLGAHCSALFTTTDELKVLANFKSIFSDGTFKVPEFNQVSAFLFFYF